MALAATSHHVSFPVRDLDRARSFYEDLLGLQRIARPDLGFPGAWYQAGPCEVHLLEVPPDADVGMPPHGLNPLAPHCAFAVVDYEEALAAVRRRGLEVVETSSARGQLWVRDPDGHVIELIAPPRAD